MLYGHRSVSMLPRSHATALPVEILDDAGSSTGVTFYVMHPVLCMESRVHNVVGLGGHYDTERGHKQLRASILFAREFMRDVLNGRIEAEAPVRAVMKLNERIFRFCMRDRHAKEVYRSRDVDPAAAIVDNARFPAAFRDKRLPQMREQLAGRRRLTPKENWLSCVALLGTLTANLLAHASALLA